MAMAMARAFLLSTLILLPLGCIQQAKEAVQGPTPTGGGTLTCRQIVETCDSQCSDPICVRRCGDQGTPEAAEQHTALVDCAQRSGCTDEDCIRTSCPGESSTCEGPEPAADPAPAAAPSGPPGAASFHR
ncbi:MAG TPA: hypothetical protein VFQ53_24145 [Kofleriaceae bacterium]|nr:hypothetical protein [Kofleriaceae bacterium]